MAVKKKTVAVEVAPEMHAAWTAAAKKAGVSLRAYVTGAVERQVAEGVPPPARARPTLTRPAPALVRPQDCTARVRAGSYCRRCDSIHVKGI